MNAWMNKHTHKQMKNKRWYRSRILFICCFQIDKIPYNYFKKIPCLRELYLSHNQIKHLDEDAFKGASHVYELSVSSMNLTFVHPNALVSLCKLFTLDVSNTQLCAAPRLCQRKLPMIPDGIYIQQLDQYNGGNIYLFIQAFLNS